MKRLFFSLFAVVIVTQVSALELWNGFTSGMSVDQVIQYAAKTLGKEKGQVTTYTKFEVFTDFGTCATLNQKFLQCDKCLIYKYSSLPYMEDADENIIFYFYENSLYAVFIAYETNIKVFLDKVYNTYGKETYIFPEHSPSSNLVSWERNWYVWNNLEKEIYISTTVWGKGTVMTVYDRNYK
ncbi:MAG: hypothetical protein WCR31_08285 [Treponema sp.]